MGDDAPQRDDVEAAGGRLESSWPEACPRGRRGFGRSVEGVGVPAGLERNSRELSGAAPEIQEPSARQHGERREEVATLRVGPVWVARLLRLPVVGPPPVVPEHPPEPAHRTLCETGRAVPGLDARGSTDRAGTGWHSDHRNYRLGFVVD